MKQLKFTLSFWKRWAGTTLVLASVAAAPGADELISEPISPMLLSQVADQDLPSVQKLRNSIYDHACDSNVIATLHTLATNNNLGYEAIDLIVHAAIFCPTQGEELFDTMLSNFDATNVNRKVVQDMIGLGIYGFKKTNNTERLAKIWEKTNEEQSVLANSNSEDDIRSWINNYRIEKSTITRRKILETLSWYGGEEKRGFVIEMALEMAELDPADPYLLTAVGTIQSVQGRQREAVENLRIAWLNKRHIGALYPYAATVLKLDSLRDDNNYETEVRTVVSDLLRFQKFNPNFTVQLLFAGANLSVANPENQLLMNQVLEELDKDLLRSNPQFKTAYDLVIHRWKPDSPSPKVGNKRVNPNH